MRTVLALMNRNRKLFFKEKGLIYKRGVSPIEFLNYIQDAEYIVTNSFHGTAFSIIFVSLLVDHSSYFLYLINSLRYKTF